MSHPDPSPAPTRRRGASLAPILIVAAAGLGAAAGYITALRGPDWLPPRRAAAPAPAVRAADPQPATDARLADMQARPMAQQPAQTAEDRIVGAGAEVRALDERLSLIERRQAGALQAAAAALAVSALDQAAQGSGPFAAQLAQVGRSLPPSDDLQRLVLLAPSGAPSRAALAAGFHEASRQALIARPARPEDGWLARIAQAFATVVTVRRLDATGQGVDAALARAQARLDDGDLEGALADLRVLPAPTRKAMGTWIAHAERRVEVDHGVAALRVQALQRLQDEGAILAQEAPAP